MASSSVTKRYQEEEIKKVISKTNEELNEWKRIPLKVAITGRSGVGKSSLINALIGIGPRDPGAAKVGVVQTTEKVQYYPHPVNSNLIFYDLPGVGTPTFPRDDYLEREDIGFSNYDNFIIVAASRFMEDDVWLGLEIAKQEKSFVFVRSQIDIELIKNKNSNDASIQQTINLIRKDCKKIFKAVDSAKVYLVNSYDTENELFDFNDLNSHLIASIPEWKRKAFVLAMSTTTRIFIDEKEKVLTERIYKIALLSALGGAIPVPGASMVIDVAIILEEIHFYQTQYGIPQALQSIRKTAKLSTAEAIFKFLKLSDYSSTVLKTAAWLIAKIPSLLASEVLERSATLLIPILGSIVGGAISYNATVYILKQILAKIT